MKYSRKEINNRINVIKQMYGAQPQCYLVATLLSTEFQGEIWYDANHCIVRIGEFFYDRHGLFSESLAKYRPLKEYGISQEHNLLVAMVEWLTFGKKELSLPSTLNFFTNNLNY